MDAKELIKLRKLAEQVVADMDDGALKVKAFEVVLAQLVKNSQGTSSGDESTKVTKKKKTSNDDTSLRGRILVLCEEGFFTSQRTIGNVKEELAAHGWHYPTTSLSGSLQDLVRKRELRREKVITKNAKKGVWKYSNP